MSVTQYIGARYVPLFADPIDWDSTRQYEPLTIVYYQGNSYTSKQAVPSGIDISNTTYWVQTGNYNAQIEQYRAEVAQFNGRITENAQDIADEVAARMAEDTDLTNAIAAEESARIAADTTLEGAITAEATAREAADTTLEGAITAEATAREAADNALIEDIKAQHVIGGFAAPECVGTYMSDYQMGSCLRVGDNMYAFNPFNDGSGDGEARRWNISGNTLLTTVTRAMGHANSACYDATRNRILVAGLFNGTVGDHTPDPNIYVFDTNLNAIDTIQLPGSRSTGEITCDPKTGIVYSMCGGTTGWDVYILNPDDTEFTLAYNIPYSIFNMGDDFMEQLWQDMAVYDGIGFWCRYEGTVYAIELDPENPTLLNTFRIGSDDAGGYWHFGEHEGLEFDANGNLYQARNGICGIVNEGKPHEVNCCFITSVNTANNIEQSQFRRHAILASVYVNDENKNKLIMDRYQLQDLNQIMYLQAKPTRAEVPQGKTYTAGKVRVNDRLAIDVIGTMTCAELNIQGGPTMLRVRENATLNMNRQASQTRDYAISLTERPNQMGIRNEGAIQFTGFSQLAYGGALPVIVAYTGSGTVNGANSTTINGVSNVSAGTVLAGGYTLRGNE